MLALSGSCLASFLIQPRNAHPGNSAAHDGLDPQVLTNNLDTTCTPDMSIGQPDMGNASIETLLSTPGCAKLTVKAD